MSNQSKQNKRRMTTNILVQTAEHESDVVELNLCGYSDASPSSSLEGVASFARER